MAAEHDTRSTVRAWLGRKAFYGTGSALLGSRHGNYVAPAALSPSYALAGAAVLARHPLAGLLVVAALLRGHRAISRVLPKEANAASIALRIAVRGMGWTVRQESALLLRHWWPATVIIGLRSERMRRAMLTALGVDLLVALKEIESLPWRDLPGHLAARRLDDFASGLGVWRGVVRARHVGALLPRWSQP